MEVLTLRELSFSYPQADAPALDHVSLGVEAGAFFVLCGPSGCGKSTLLRQCKSALVPHGARSGQVLFQGKPLEDCGQRLQAQAIGFVQQSPDNQIVTDKVWHELAFGLESLGRDTPFIRRRVAEMASFFGIQDWFDRDVASLSGGQKQLLNLAAVMTLDPDLLILDEPTSQLDPIAAADFLSVLGKLNRELGVTVLLTEHRLEEALPLASHVAVLDRGRLVNVGTPQEVGRALRIKNHPMFLAMPTPLRVWAAVDDANAAPPLTVREGRDWLERYAAGHQLRPLPDEVVPEPSNEVALSGRELFFRYEKDSPDVLRGLSLEVRRGEFFALLGGNGVGKSTLLKLLSGLQKPQRGELTLHGSVAAVPQDPQALFVKKTLRADLLELCLDEGKADQVVELCQLSGLLERHPFDLSGGERQRAALAKVLLLEPDVLLLDEPTKGLDAQFKRTLAGILQSLTARGVTILMVSHDVEFCAAYAHRCALMFRGDIVTQGTPRSFFSGNSFYTTAANRMGRTVEPQAVTADDLAALCGAQAPPPPTPPDDVPSKPPQAKSPSQPKPPKKSRASRRSIVAAVMILLTIPLTLFVGVHFMEGKKYYFIALLVLLEAMLPFFLLFEGRRPQARELVVIAVLCAIAVAARAAFFMLPQFKPVLALTIVAGVAFGGETGFLVGAMTMLLSNILFSQGPWTPFQMFAMGLAGFLAGALFHRGALPRSKGPLSVFGGLCAIFIYGGMMNPASVLMWADGLDWRLLLTSYLTGLPMDCVHAGATFLFLWLAAEPMLEKLDRVKGKYGLVA